MMGEAMHCRDGVGRGHIFRYGMGMLFSAVQKRFLLGYFVTFVPIKLQLVLVYIGITSVC